MASVQQESYIPLSFEEHPLKCMNEKEPINLISSDEEYESDSSVISFTPTPMSFISKSIKNTTNNNNTLISLLNSSEDEYQSDTSTISTTPIPQRYMNKSNKNITNNNNKLIDSIQPMKPQTFSKLVECNKGHSLIKQIANDLIDFDESYPCNSCDVKQNPFATVFDCNKCNYGLCSTCHANKQKYVQKRGVKRLLSDPFTTQPNKRRKISIENENNYTICPWHIGAQIISKNGCKATIRDYDVRNQLSIIWYTQIKNKYGKIDLFNNNNWSYSKNQNISEIRSIPKNIWWKAPKLELYDKVYIKSDMEIYNNEWFEGIIIGFDHISRRHCIDYIGSTEWLYLYNNRTEIRWNMSLWNEELIEEYTPAKDDKLNEQIELYKDKIIKCKLPPLWTCKLYGLTSEFEDISNEIYTPRNEIICNNINGIYRSQKYIEMNDKNCNNCDCFIQPYYAYYERDFDIEFKDDSDIEFINDTEYKPPKSKRKKQQQFLPGLGYRNCNNNIESDDELILYPYEVKASDHRITPIEIKCIIISYLMDYFGISFEDGKRILDVSPYRCNIDVNDHTLWGKYIAFCNPNYSKAWPQIDECWEHTQINNEISVLLIPYGGHRDYWARTVWPNGALSITLSHFAFLKSPNEQYNHAPMFPTTIVFFTSGNGRNKRGIHPHGYENVKEFVNEKKECGEYEYLVKLARENIIDADVMLKENDRRIYEKLKREGNEKIRSKT